MSPQYKAPRKRWQSAASWQDIRDILSSILDETERATWRVRRRAGDKDLSVRQHPETKQLFAPPPPPSTIAAPTTDPAPLPPPPPASPVPEATSAGRAAWGAVAGVVGSALYLGTVRAGTGRTGILCMFLTGLLLSPAFLMASAHQSWRQVFASTLALGAGLDYWIVRVTGGLLSIAWLWLASTSFDRFATWSPLPIATTLVMFFVALGSGLAIFFHWCFGRNGRRGRARLAAVAGSRHPSISAALSGMPLAVVASCGILAMGLGADVEPAPASTGALETAPVDPINSREAVPAPAPPDDDDTVAQSPAVVPAATAATPEG